MTKIQFDNYKFSISTEVKFRGEWTAITEVWFDDGKIGIKSTGHLIDYSEVEEIRN